MHDLCVDDLSVPHVIPVVEEDQVEVPVAPHLIHVIRTRDDLEKPALGIQCLLMTEFPETLVVQADDERRRQRITVMRRDSSS